MTSEKELEVLKSWLEVAYQNTDGTDDSSAELYEALQTVFHHIIEKLQEVIFKQKETIQLISLEKQKYFDGMNDLRSRIMKEGLWRRVVDEMENRMSNMSESKVYRLWYVLSL